MSITYTKFNEIGHSPTGSVVLANHVVYLADSINSKLINGIGNGPQRIWLYNYNLTRQLLAYPSSPNNNPSEALFPFYWQYVNNNSDPLPTAYPGGDGGANNANPLTQFVFGLQTGEEPGTYIEDSYTGDPALMGEGDRLSTLIPDITVGSDYDVWSLASSQCGLYDTGSGLMSSPSFDAAQSYLRMAFPEDLPYEKTAGGYMPVAEQGSACADGRINWIMKFQNLNTGTIDSYETCPPDQGGSLTNLYYYYKGPFSYIIYLYNGNIIEYPYSEWKVILDGGGSLGRVDGNQTSRLLLSSYLRLFRGVGYQRPSTGYDIRDVAYDFAGNFQRQYQLAPQFAVISASVLTNDGYQMTASFSSSVPVSSSAFAIHSNFCVPRIWGVGHGLASPCPVEIYYGNQLFATFNIPIESDGTPNTGSYIDIYDVGITGSWYCKLPNGTPLAVSSGSVYIEAAELLQYQQEWYDAYLTIRMESAKNISSDSEQDQSGDTFTRANEITLQDYGCLLNINGGSDVYQQQTAFNLNPVYQSYRMFVNQFIKTIHATDINGSTDTSPGLPLIKYYEKNATGSCLYVVPKINNFTLFDNLIDLNNSASNSIYRLAPTGSWTNDWVMFQCNKLMREDDAASIFKPNVYSDYFGYINRAMIYSPEVNTSLHQNENVHTFVNSQDAATAGPTPEALDELNYVSSAPGVAGSIPINFGCDADYYKSNPVYPKPYRLIEARYVNVSGEELVKLQFDSYFQCCDEEEATFSYDTSTWNASNIASEPYRTDSNAIREFLLSSRTLKKGDCAYNAYEFLDENPDRPEGGYPTLYFVKLVPKPYVASSSVYRPIESSSVYPCPLNGTVSNSSPSVASFPIMLSQLYTVAMCDGYIAGISNIENACNNVFDPLFDYTEETLCQEAFGRNNFSILTGSWRYPYSNLNRGYGAMENMDILMTHINEIGKCQNLLTKARLCLPYQIELTGSSYLGVQPSVSSDVNDFFGDNTHWAKNNDYIGAPATTLVSSGPEYLFSGTPSDMIAYTHYTIDDTGCEANTKNVITNRYVLNYRYRLTDPAAYNAVNSDIQELMANGDTGMFANVLDNSQWFDMSEEAIGDDCVLGSGDNHWYSSKAEAGLHFAQQTPLPSYCVFVEGGIIDAGLTPPPSALSYCGGNDNLAASTETMLVANSMPIVLKVPLV